MGLLIAAVACEIVGSRCPNQGRPSLLGLAWLYTAALMLLARAPIGFPLGSSCLLFGVPSGALTMLRLLIGRAVFDRAGLAGSLVIGTGGAALQAPPFVALPLSREHVTYGILT